MNIFKRKKPPIQFNLYGNVVPQNNQTLEKKIIDWGCPIKIKCYYMWQTDHTDSLFLIRHLSKLKQERPFSGFLEITAETFTFAIRDYCMFSYKVKDLVKVEFVSHSNVLSVTVNHFSSYVFALKYPYQNPPANVCDMFKSAYKKTTNRLLPVFEVDSNYNDEISARYEQKRTDGGIFQTIKNKLKLKKKNKSYETSKEVEKETCTAKLLSQQQSANTADTDPQTFKELVVDDYIWIDENKLEETSGLNSDCDISENTGSKESRPCRRLLSATVRSSNRRRFVKRCNSDGELYAKNKSSDISDNKSISTGDLRKIFFNFCQVTRL